MDYHGDEHWIEQDRWQQRFDQADHDADLAQEDKRERLWNAINSRNLSDLTKLIQGNTK